MRKLTRPRQGFFVPCADGGYLFWHKRSADDIAKELGGRPVERVKVVPVPEKKRAKERR